MEGVLAQQGRECLHLLIRNFDACWVNGGVQFRSDPQSGFCSCGSDQVDDDFVTGERFAAPVHADVGEQAMFNFIPLAGARRQVANRDRDPGLLGQPLQFDLPQP